MTALVSTSIKLSWIFSAVLIVFLLVFYIFQVVRSTEAGFIISNYEKQITEFSRESKILNSDFSQLNSLVNLEIVLAGLDYEKIGKIHYLRLPGSQVAAK